MYSWLEINKDSIEHNISQYKKIIANNILAAVVKGNAYGHGLLPIAQIIECDKEVDWLCVSHLSDALLLRRNKINKPILVLSSIDIDPANAINQNVAIVVGGYDTAKKLNNCGKQYNYSFNIHIKVDTGLSRLGVAEKYVFEFIQYIRTLSFVTITGICSHFAQAQEKDQSFTNEQFKQFNNIVENLSNYGTSVFYRHISNSAGTIIEQPLCNVFRFGIGMYGYWPSQANKLRAKEKYPLMTLKPALTWKTRVIEIKNIPANVSVGYNCTYRTKKPITIALLPVGYYDGYQMRFSNKSWVRIKNCYAPVIGRVCMNMTIIDVSNIPTVAIGDEVILLGDDPKINACALADCANIDNIREIFTTINPQLPRLII